MRTSVFAAAVATAVAFATPALAGVITVTSPAGLYTNNGPSNASGPGAGLDTWFANNVRMGGSAGITSAYGDAGNGSIQFGSPTNAKADFEYYFSNPNTFLLSSLNALSYDLYRSSSSTASARYEPALRLYVSDGSHTGYLVFEGIYNGQQVAPVDAFAPNNVIGSKFWGTGTLPDAFSNYDRTLADWAVLLPELRVLGLSTGVGSGWDGTFSGAVDEITYGTVQKGSTTFNFEVAAAAADVPEPASIALLGAGLLGVPLVRGRRKRG